AIHSFSFLLIRPPPTSPLFPYTTLFRSAVAMPNQIRAGDVTPRTFHGFQSNTGFAKRLRRKNQIFRNDAIFEDFLVMINIVYKDVQRMDALPEAPLDRRPLIGWNNPRHDVERKDLFGTRVVAINIERDAHAEQSLFGRLLVPAQLCVPDRTNPLQQQARTWARRAVRLEHLIVKISGVVAFKKHKKSVRQATCLGTPSSSTLLYFRYYNAG